MWPIVTDVPLSTVCVSDSVLGTQSSCAKMAEPIMSPFGDESREGAAVRGDKTAMWPFVKQLWTLDSCLWRNKTRVKVSQYDC